MIWWTLTTRSSTRCVPTRAFTLSVILTEIYSQLFIAGIYHSACIYLFRVLELVPALATLPPLARTPAESSLRILYMAMYTSKIRCVCFNLRGPVGSCLYFAVPAEIRRKPSGPVRSSLLPSSKPRLLTCSRVMSDSNSYPRLQDPVHFDFMLRQVGPVPLLADAVADSVCISSGSATSGLRRSKRRFNCFWRSKGAKFVEAAASTSAV